uniref:RING-type E3 ubiquitin transferase n=1 Tax=Chrysemys picta bellii TaxID=8478 RepID=A0A8C3P705_CHRPI
GQTKGPSSPGSSAMASAAPVQGIQEETKCPICLEYLTDPVTMDCGHNFCQGCISNYCDKWEEYGPLECPVCRHRIRKGNLRSRFKTNKREYFFFHTMHSQPVELLARGCCEGQDYDRVKKITR